MNISYSHVIKPAGPGQIVAYTGTHGVIANPIPAGAAGVWVFCTSTAYVAIGADPTATSTAIPLPANVPVLIPIPNNKGDTKVSAVQETAGGNLHVLPVADC